MTEFLVRRFVKDSDRIDDSKVRTSYGILASVVGIISNILLFAVKAAVGAVLGSIAVIADAFNNLSDAASSIISFVGVRLADKPADKEHPFGHGRYEYIAAFIVAFMIIEVGITFVKSSWGKIIDPGKLSFNFLSVVFLCATILVKVWLSLFNRKLGDRINSTVMKAAAADALGDVLTTSATIAALLIYRFFGWNIDGYMGIVVAGVVIIAGFNIAKDTLKPLLGEAADPGISKKIQKMVESYEGILGSHDLIVHNYGPTQCMATIHAEVPNDVDIEKSHELIDRIEREVTKKTGVFLVIHMDPVEVKNEKVLKFRSMLFSILNEIDPKVSAHDFRMVWGDEQINLIFDLVVPREYDDKKQEILAEMIMKKVQEKDHRCQCVMTIEYSFIAE